MGTTTDAQDPNLPIIQIIQLCFGQDHTFSFLFFLEFHLNFSFLKACFIELKRLKRIKNLEPFKRYGLAAATCLIPSLSLLLAANHAISLCLIQVSTAVAVRHKLHNPTPFVRLRRNKRPGFSLSLSVFFSRIFCPVHYVSCVCVCVAGKELCGDCDTKATTSKS